MARASSSDFLQNFRFHAEINDFAGEDGVDPLEFVEGEREENAPYSQAGFQNISIPEVNTESVEYRDGLSIYPVKQPGPASVGDSTMQRGIALEDTAFFEWVLDAANDQEYRADITVYIFPNDAAPQRNFASDDGAGGEDGPFNPDNARQIVFYDAFPTRVKMNSDLDATAGDISVGEIDLAIERVGVTGAATDDGEIIK